MDTPELDRVSGPPPGTPTERPEIFCFAYGGLQITVESKRDGEILSVTDSQGNTWTRQA